MRGCCLANTSTNELGINKHPPISILFKKRHVCIKNCTARTVIFGTPKAPKYSKYAQFLANAMIVWSVNSKQSYKLILLRPVMPSAMLATPRCVMIGSAHRAAARVWKCAVLRCVRVWRVCACVVRVRFRFRCSDSDSDSGDMHTIMTMMLIYVCVQRLERYAIIVGQSARGRPAVCLWCVKKLFRPVRNKITLWRLYSRTKIYF